jgi:hypothetical protein
VQSRKGKENMQKRKARAIVWYRGEAIFRNVSAGYALRWSCTGYGAADTLQGMKELIKGGKA